MNIHMCIYIYIYIMYRVIVYHYMIAYNVIQLAMPYDHMIPIV